MKKITFTKREDELMNFLWEQTEPLSVDEMASRSEELNWSEAYIRVMVRSLEHKGLLECCGVEPRGKQYARRFRPAISREEHYTRLAISAGADAGTLAKVAVAAVAKDRKENSEDLIKQLEAIVDDFKARNGEAKEDK